jgi:ubiquinone/menaquinone biosynthesis C-methylase UbiE
MALNSIYDDDPERYQQHRDCWLNRRRALFVAERLRGYRLPPGGRVLEIGSGTGQLLRELSRQFPELSFWGLEPQASYIEFALQRAGPEDVRYVRGTAEQAHNLLNGTFHAILSNDVLHHVESLERSASSVARLAASGCRWLAIEPNSLNLYAQIGQWRKPEEHPFRPKEFLIAARASGWSLKQRRYLFLVPPFVREAPGWLKALERRLEGIPFAGGGICLECVFGGSQGPG